MARSDQQLRNTSDRLLGPSASWLWCVPGCVCDWYIDPRGGPHRILTAAGVLWTAATLWIGLGCAWNARACGRVHCFVDSVLLPTLALVGALNVADVIAISWNPYWAAFMVIIVASFVPEVLGRRYI